MSRLEATKPTPSKVKIAGLPSVPAPVFALCQAVFLLFVFAVLISSCGFAGTPPQNEIVVTISPTSATVTLGQAQQFQATVSGSSNATVNWSINGIAGGNTTNGTISAAGLFTAPSSLPSPATVTVSATSAADTQRSASAVVTLSDSLRVSVAPTSVSVATGAAQAFTASVSGAGTSSTSLIWSVNGITGGNSTVGTIVANGADSAVYTAPVEVPSPSSVSVAATSAQNPQESGAATVTITCGSANSISPSSASVSLGQTQSFVATLCNAAGAQIVWDVNGVTGGNASTGTILVTGATMALYTAPQDLPSPSSIQIHATSGASTAGATVSITSAVTVAIAPAEVALNLNQRQTFTPTVTNTSDARLTWAVNGVSNGSAAVGQICELGSSPCQPLTGAIAGAVDYVAPISAPAQNPVAISAVSVADPSRSSTAVVTINGQTPAVAINISPFYQFLAPSAGTPSSAQFFANVTGSSNTAVTWTIQSGVAGQGCSGSSCGSIAPNGSAQALYTAPTSAPSPNAISIVATSLADSSKSATATVAITSGPVIEVMLPSSVFSGAVESFPLAVQGANFAAGTGSSASAILVNGVARGTTCATATGCVTALNLADVQTPGTITIQVQNPPPSNALSNPVPFVVVPLDTSVGAFALSAANPTITQIQLAVPEPTTAAASAPINVDSIGLLTDDDCEIQGSPVTITRPASGTITASLCIHGNLLDPTFTYSFSGAGGAPDGSDLPVTASAIPGLFPNLIELDLQLSSSTLPGVRTLFISTLNNDRAVATGMLEVK